MGVISLSENTWTLWLCSWEKEKKDILIALTAKLNGPFWKLSRAMLVTSFGGQCRKKTAIF